MSTTAAPRFAISTSTPRTLPSVMSHARLRPPLAVAPATAPAAVAASVPHLALPVSPCDTLVATGTCAGAAGVSARGGADAAATDVHAALWPPCFQCRFWWLRLQYHAWRQPLHCSISSFTTPQTAQTAAAASTAAIASQRVVMTHDQRPSSARHEKRYIYCLNHVSRNGSYSRRGRFSPHDLVPSTRCDRTCGHDIAGTRIVSSQTWLTTRGEMHWEGQPSPRQRVSRLLEHWACTRVKSWCPTSRPKMACSHVTACTLPAAPGQ